MKSVNLSLPKIRNAHRFLFLIIGSIIIATGMVAVSLLLYVNSGAAQLDLSRPDHASIREKVKDTPIVESFPSDGELSEKDLETFISLYNEHLEDLTAVDAYGGDVLSPESLRIDAKSVEE